ncbi:MAG: fibronectin type III domain-containing protein [Nitrospira sp.]|nr:fibronectin type III domain-containing protein [Nitrospira sp.]
MLRNAISLGLAHRNFTIAIAQVIVLGLIALPLAGCGADGQGGPTISSLSTPSDAHSGEGTQSDSNPATTGSPAEDDPAATSTEHATAHADAEHADAEHTAEEQATAEHETAHAAANAAEDSAPEAEVEPAEGEEDPTISLTATRTGATARLTWEAYPDSNVAGYSVHYGKQSSGEPGSCSYEESQSVEAPPAIITGLEPNTPYFFAISAYGGEVGESESSSSCSNEVLVVTPAAQS